MAGPAALRLGLGLLGGIVFGLALLQGSLEFGQGLGRRLGQVLADHGGVAAPFDPQPLQLVGELIAPLVVGHVEFPAPRIGVDGVAQPAAAADGIGADVERRIAGVIHREFFLLLWVGVRAAAGPGGKK